MKDSQTSVEIGTFRRESNALCAERARWILSEHVLFYMSRVYCTQHLGAQLRN